MRMVWWEKEYLIVSSNVGIAIMMRVVGMAERQVGGHEWITAHFRLKADPPLLLNPAHCAHHPHTAHAAHAAHTAYTAYTVKCNCTRCTMMQPIFVKHELLSEPTKVTELLRI